MMMLDTLHANEQQQSGTRHKQVSQARANQSSKWSAHNVYAHGDEGHARQGRHKVRKDVGPDGVAAVGLLSGEHRADGDDWRGRRGRVGQSVHSEPFNLKLSSQIAAARRGYRTSYSGPPDHPSPRATLIPPYHGAVSIINSVVKLELERSAL
jgi:hypothetical protein